VHRHAGLYCSDDALKRRRAQNARNAGVLEHTLAVNELGQDYKLADLAAKGTANKAIRRAELMTRIAGFELIAKSMGHAAMMLTVTCPSRMHARKTVDGKPVENPKYDGTTPREAQAYLAKQWARMRAAAARRMVSWYGFRIAEPQQDGTPHWHTLLFFSEQSAQQIRGLADEFFLQNDNPGEPGAHRHRVDVELIDWAKGSAVAYIAKYISKNIDGYAVGDDLYGEPAIESSARVEAWAATWGIRQFQQVGGAPVGVWRELRRVNPEELPQDTPQGLLDCLSAMNLAAVEPGIQSAAWKRYTLMQGGPYVRRADLAVKVKREAVEGELNSYGEPMPPKPVGIMGLGHLVNRSLHALNVLRGHEPAKRLVSAQLDSERVAWRVVTGQSIEAVRAELELARAMDLIARSAGYSKAGSEAARPWTRVNNCTQPPRSTDCGARILAGRRLFDGSYMPEMVDLLAPLEVHRPKTGRMRWSSRDAGETNGENHG
jgi:hypothetical protein